MFLFFTYVQNFIFQEAYLVTCNIRFSYLTNEILQTNEVCMNNKHKNMHIRFNYTFTSY